MAKKRPPGWKKKQEEKLLEKFGPPVAPGFEMYSGEEAREKLGQLLERLENHPDRFEWGYFDSNGVEVSSVSRETLENQVRVENGQAE